MMYVRDGIKATSIIRSRLPGGGRRTGGRYCQGELYRRPDTFRQVVETVKIPVIIAGGPKMDTVDELLVWLRGQHGAKGAAIGRNIFKLSGRRAYEADSRNSRQLFGWVMGLEGDGVDMGIAVALSMPKGQSGKSLSAGLKKQQRPGCRRPKDRSGLYDSCLAAG